MATDANTGQPIFNYNSWGRTRSPKNLTGTQGGAIVVLEHDGGGPSGITATDGTGGYATENQRYLHVTVDNAGGADPAQDIQVWVYSHASGIWSFLNSTSANPNPINCDAIVQNTTYKIAIYGVDRVAFVRDTGDWDHAPTAVYAACSTF